MRLNLIVFIMGMVFIVIGYVKQIKPNCKDSQTIKYIPLSVYQELESDKPYLNE
tara:strand:- start:7968 stop:8129 length:162 start_codon:yes stop_codon:yes gene_type:complete